MLFVLNRFDYIPLVYVILLTLNSNALAEVDLIEQIYHSTMNKGELNSISEMDNNYFQGEKVYLDSLEENQILSVFNKPGFDWHSCQNDGRLRASETYQKCEAVGWLDRKANVYRMAMKGQGNETYEVTQLITKYEEGFEHKVSYSYIYFRYARFYIDPKDGSWQTNEKSGYGWIPTSYLSKVFFPPFYPTINNNIVQPQNNQVVQSNAGRIEEKKIKTSNQLKNQLRINLFQ